jgi:hypothetical protein
LPSELILVLVLLFGTYVALITPTLRRLCRPCKVDEFTPQWLERFSAHSYDPMEQLLNPEDFAFLSRQPGFDFALYRKLRRDRLRIFRQYLNRMIGDFNRLHAVARMLTAHSPEDQSEMFTRLIWLKVRFSLAVLRAESRYLCCFIGARSVSVRELILQLDELSGQVTAMSTMQSA